MSLYTPASFTLGNYPATRLRRLRRYEWSRALIKEHHVQLQDLIWPVFIREGHDIAEPVASMPGVFRYSIDRLVFEVQQAAGLGIQAVALFPVIDASSKTETAEEAWNSNNLMSRAIAAIKKAVPHIGIIGDVALDPYTSHGQDGLMHEGEVLNDETVEALSKQAIALATAGCDIVAPSDMMDGRIGAIRQALDQAGWNQVIILSYAAKYASGFYGPFRDALGSASSLGKANKATYQMDPANGREALREVAQDIAEGADMVMIKPGLPYLDIITQIHSHYPIPVLAYQVSGEYAMIKAAALQGWLDESTVWLETMLAFKRAGASAIFTYAAREIATLLQRSH